MGILERFSLKGQRALVTGASQGIGLACAQALAEAGAHVILTARDEALLAKVAGDLAAAGHSAEWQVLDVTDSAAADALAAKLGPLDVVVANAGIARSGTAAELAGDALVHDVMNTNFYGVLYTARAFGGQMLTAGKGSIVAIGSISGDISNRPQNQSYYNASKAAVHHLVRSMGAEWAGRGVRVNAVAPGYIETQMTKYAMVDDPVMAAKWMELTPMARAGQPEEIASIVLFLASSASSYMTGSVVTADGGYTCW
ncbi:MAG TPA: SDR family oxidoreductase [Gemmobacter sp.]|nr:SDR family oxidoreductase [Gemmobacter sp.]